MKADVVVIGGGASGLTAAICAAREGARVIVLDRMARIGKKILATGNGRCNYTNEDMGPEYYHSQMPVFVSQILKRFNEKETIQFFKQLGIIPKSNGGYVYPNSMQAVSILESLIFELNRLHVKVIENAEVSRITIKGRGYQINAGNEFIHCRRLILACGGRASEKLGSNGSGYHLARSLGHSIIPVVPALTGLRAKDAIYKQLAGVRVDGKVSLYIDGHLKDSHRGEIQLAEYGISGIPVFQLSGQAAYGLQEGKEVQCFLDFFPDMPEETLKALLIERKKQFTDRPAEVFETGILNKKLIRACMKLSGASRNKLPDMGSLAHIIKHFPAFIQDSRGFDFAQVCAGGVDLKEIWPQSCESKIHSGLYIIGELMDADGVCGGYNLQWAWATGYIAGTHAGKECYDTNYSN